MKKRVIHHLGPGKSLEQYVKNLGEHTTKIQKKQVINGTRLLWSTVFNRSKASSSISSTKFRILDAWMDVSSIKVY